MIRTVRLSARSRVVARQPNRFASKKEAFAVHVLRHVLREVVLPSVLDTSACAQLPPPAEGTVRFCPSLRTIKNRSSNRNIAGQPEFVGTAVPTETVM